MPEMKSMDNSSDEYKQMNRKFHLYRIVVDSYHDETDKSAEEVSNDCLALFDPNSFGNSEKYGSLFVHMTPPSDSEFIDIRDSLMELITE